MKEAGCVVMLVARAAAVRPGIRITAAVGAMCAGSRRLVVIGVPEQPAVESRLVLLRVVDIYVDVMTRCILHQTLPAAIPGAHEIQESAINEVVLIVVVGNERMGPAMMD